MKRMLSVKTSTALIRFQRGGPCIRSLGQRVVDVWGVDTAGLVSRANTAVRLECRDTTKRPYCVSSIKQLSRHQRHPLWMELTVGKTKNKVIWHLRLKKLSWEYQWSEMTASLLSSSIAAMFVSTYRNAPNPQGKWNKHFPCGQCKIEASQLSCSAAVVGNGSLT